MYQSSSQAPNGLADTYPLLDTNDHRVNGDSNTDDEVTRIPKRKVASQSPLVGIPYKGHTLTEAAPGTLKRKMPNKKAQDRYYAPETYDDDSEGMEDEPITPEPKPAFKKRRTSSDSEMDVDIPIASIEGTSSRATIRFDVPHEHDIFHGGWDNSRLKRRSIAHEDNETAFVPQSDDSDDSDDPVHITENEKSEVVFDFSTEKARRWTDAINLPENIYNEAEQDLFFRLSMRGFEPALPSHWKFDFPTLPISLFPEPALGFEPILQISGASEFYAIKSLATLFSLGGRVRDCKILRKKPEPLIRNSIHNYIRWAMRDAKVCISKDAVSLHAIYAQREGIMETLKRLDRRLHHLVRQYQEVLGAPSTDATQNGDSSRRKYPTFIGFIVSGPTVVILTRNSDPTIESENSDSTFMCQFDLGERGQDVWNSLAIAITVMHIRRNMLQLAEDGVAGYKKLLEGEEMNVGPDVDL